MDRPQGWLGLFLLVGGVASTSNAAQIVWTDWESSDSSSGFVAEGTITTTTATVGVTYSNPTGVAFFQSAGDTLTDYFQNARTGTRDPATSPFTSDFVENIPPAGEMIALNRVGSQTLTFTEPIANPVFSYVSLNGNGYAFDQDFEILSFGDASDGNDNGYWGAGTSYKEIVDLGGGAFEYQLLGTGEPHGTLRFTGAFESVTWRSLTSENWNGFTVGVEGTAAEILPEPASLGVLLTAALSAVALRRRAAASPGVIPDHARYSISR